MNPQTYDPYCGPPPVPASIWTSWNLDPWLLVAIGVDTCLLHRRFKREAFSPGRDGSTRLWRSSSSSIAFVSPLCRAEFGALLRAGPAPRPAVAAAAPLLALAFPARPFLRRIPLTALFLAHTLAMWVWHAPAPYAFALSSHAAYC